MTEQSNGSASSWGMFAGGAVAALIAVAFFVNAQSNSDAQEECDRATAARDALIESAGPIVNYVGDPETANRLTAERFEAEEKVDEACD